MTTTRVLQRQILPVDRDTDVFALYVDAEAAVLDADIHAMDRKDAGVSTNEAEVRRSVAKGVVVHPDQIEDRHAFRLPRGDRISFGTYFNAFPASYWRRWTVVSEVRLTVVLRGLGATVIVYRSMPDGRSQRVDGVTSESAKAKAFSFDLPLRPFADGGWYWYDVVAGDTDVVVESAEWSAEVPEDRVTAGSVSIGITTMNRTDFCTALVGQIAADEHLREHLDELIVVDQGSQRLVEADGFDEVAHELGSQLRVIEQANLGGSGGYARSQWETLKKGSATYFLCMDDDIVCEPEGIVRALTFADLARRPTLVGGHMFSIFQRSSLYSFGEIVDEGRFWWRSPDGAYTNWDLAGRNLRSSRWLHRRLDADFNGWFMCLIPTSVLGEIGLSLPLFLKWDDSEYGLRAKQAGYPTVALPGAAVWHVPWTDKNDEVDWQAYFHQRNRFIAALLHWTSPRGTQLLKESFAVQVKHLISMQYSTAEIRLQALEDVLAGPEQLHSDLGSKLPQIRAILAGFDDARLESDPDAFPAAKGAFTGGHAVASIPSKRARYLTAVKGVLHQWQGTRPQASAVPEAQLSAVDAKWYRLGLLDSAVVSMRDQSSAAFYRRDPALFRAQLKRSVEVHRRLASQWPDLAARWRSALGEITSPEEWEKTFSDRRS